MRRGIGPQRRVFAAQAVKGETRQPPLGAIPNRHALTLLAEHAGRKLERWSNPAPRGMTVQAAQAAIQNPAYRSASLYFRWDSFTLIPFAHQAEAATRSIAFSAMLFDK